jgi:hypothetical protein
MMSNYVFCAFNRNPDLEARIQRLKVQQADRDYKRMTQNVSGRQAYTEEPLANQSKYNLNEFYSEKGLGQCFSTWVPPDI